MKKLLTTIELMCLTMGMGCSVSTYTPPPMVEKHWIAPSEEIGFRVSPGWHDGKVYPITQNLHANPVVKDRLPASNAHHDPVQ